MSRNFVIQAEAVLIALLFCAAAQGQAGTDPAALSPYYNSVQQRNHGYTSLDNPYAPGGLYDPNRTSKLLGLQDPGTKAKPQTSGRKVKPGQLESRHKGLSTASSIGLNAAPSRCTSDPMSGTPGLSSLQQGRRGVNGHSSARSISYGYAFECGGHSQQSGSSSLNQASDLNSPMSGSGDSIGMQNQFGNGSYSSNGNRKTEQLQSRQFH